MSEPEAVGKVLPNLKIIVDGEKSDTDISLEPGELLDDESVAPGSVMTKNEYICKWIDTIPPTTKVYANKQGGFETGLDLSSDVMMKKLEERAERFGLDKSELKPITQLQIDALYKSLGLDPENLISSCKNIRLGAIHMRGVTEMNTTQVIEYFKDYGPATVEWINDISCNVCWNDETSAARALLGMSQAFVIKKKSKQQEAKEMSDSEICDKEMLGKEAIIEMSDSEENGTQANESSGGKVKGSELGEIEDETKTENESNSKEESDMEVDDKTNKSDGEIEGNSKSVTPDIPVPPGHWRLGVPHPKAKAILLRFATKDDKKVRGAEKRSQYYQKYGNPNYGGLKGLISTSRKRKFQATRTRQTVEKLSGNKPAARYDAMHTSEYLKRTKMPRMKMYADEEEEKIKQRGSSSRRFTKKSSGVKSRLGSRYTKDDLHQLGHQFSSEEEVAGEPFPVTCKIPSRYNIWTDQAKAMAAEDSSSIHQVYKYQNFAFGSERALQETMSRYSKAEEEEDHFLDEDQSDRYCAYRSEREDYKNERQFGYNQYSGDLRDALNSSHKRSAPKADLRSRIQKLKEDDESPKHRSPLCMDSD